MTILLKKTTKKPNAPKQKHIHLRQKSTEWSCGDTGHLAFPKGGLSSPQGQWGSCWGHRVLFRIQLQPCGLSPKTGCRSHSPNAELCGSAKGFVTHFRHISGAPAQLWHGHTKVNTINTFSAKNSSCLVVKNK